MASGSDGPTCLATCTASANECGGSASCNGVGVTSVNICQESESDDEEGSTPEPEKSPKIPCVTDAECAALQPGLVCAEFQGAKDCTMPCSQESECDMPEMMGVKIDFLTCLDDEADTTRKACVPDVACFSDPMSCMTMPGSHELHDHARHGRDGWNGRDGRHGWYGRRIRAASSKMKWAPV